MVRARVLATLAVGFLLIGTGVSYYVSSTATGDLAIGIHDVPASWAHLIVTFSEVAVHRTGAANGTGWADLTLTATEIDFLALGNVTERLAQDRIAPGSFDAIRITIGSVHGVLAGGASVSLSISDSAVVTPVSFTVHGGGVTAVSLDLNLAQSISQSGSIWVFQPMFGQVTVG